MVGTRLPPSPSPDEGCHAAAQSPQCTAAVQEGSGLSCSTADFSEETSASVKLKYRDEGMGWGKPGSQALCSRKKGGTPRASCHQPHAEAAWAELTLRLKAPALQLPLPQHVGRDQAFKYELFSMETYAHR